MTRPKRLGVWIAAIAVALLIAWLNSRALLSALGRWLDVGRPPQPADAVVLLNGGENTRPFVAAALVRGGWAPKVILNTVALNAMQEAGSIPSSHEIALRVMDYAGVPRDHVDQINSVAHTTFDEANGVAEYLNSHPIKRLLLVTEAPHARRAEWIFRRVLANRNVEISVVSAPTDGFDLGRWWQKEEGVLFVVSEYCKLFFYALRYGWLAYEIAAAFLAAIALRTWFGRRRKPATIVNVV
jgi:uncharacterized SAM-binding protein YcdF (DUF218 family)